MSIPRLQIESNEPYHLKYRPSDFDEVIGQNNQIKSLESVLKGKSVPNTFLLTGNSGTGKTTLARIIAKYMNCEITEIDIASNNNAEYARTLVSDLEMNSLFSKKGKFLILDEVHMASKVFFGVLLKTLEEPPPNVGFALCTTDKSKIPSNILTRCHPISLNDVQAPVIQEHLDYVCKQEGLNIPKGATKQIALASKGSVRQALVYLSMCRSITSLDELSILIENEAVDDVSFTMIQEMASRNPNPIKVMGMLKRICGEGGNPAGIQAMAKSYFLKVLLNSSTNESVFQNTAIMDKLTEKVVADFPELATIIGYILKIKCSRS